MNLKNRFLLLKGFVIMSNIIPVYDILKKKIESENNYEIDLTHKEKQALTKALNSIDANGSELVYCIIRSYENEQQQDNVLPFDGKIQKSGIRFELDKFDIKLKHMINAFVAMHNKTSQ